MLFCTLNLPLESSKSVLLIIIIIEALSMMSFLRLYYTYHKLWHSRNYMIARVHLYKNLNIFDVVFVAIQKFLFTPK